MLEGRIVKAIVGCAALLSAETVFANPIPVPVPASMPLEEMSIQIDNKPHATFHGRFTFDYIPTTVTEMLFPIPPENATNIQVWQDAVPLPWTYTPETYFTVLPEYPSLSMLKWSGPFPASGAVFDVSYEHDLFQRDGQFVFFYSLGTGKYFPTYDKLTTAKFEIDLPSSYRLLDILLDGMPVDPSSYTLTGTRLDMTLRSEFRPFTKDLILVIPEPASLWLLGAGIAGLAGFSRRRQVNTRVA